MNSAGGTGSPPGPGLDALRKRMAAIGGGVGAAPRAPLARPPVLAVPASFAEVFPDGGLVKGTTITYTGTSTVLLGLLAAATAGGAWATLVGGGRRGLLAFHEMGGDLERLALIPNPGPDPPAVVAALADGIDLIVLDTAVDIAPARARTLAGRVRTHRSVLLVCGRWPHPDLRVRSQLAGADGLGAGRGRLQRVRAQIATLDRTERVRSVVAELGGSGGRTTWEIPATHERAGTGTGGHTRWRTG